MKKVWKVFSSCDCLKHILIKCGFNIPQYLSGIDAGNINTLEAYVNSENNFFDSLSLVCDHLNTYKRQPIFKFLPMHRLLILNWSSQSRLNKNSRETFNIEHPAFPPILREIIRLALSNYENKSATSNRYSELLTDFSIYLFINAGRACYEIISANILLPKAVTIGKMNIDRFLYIKLRTYYALSFISPQSNIFTRTKIELLKVIYGVESLPIIYKEQILQNLSSFRKMVRVLYIKLFMTQVPIN